MKTTIKQISSNMNQPRVSQIWDSCIFINLTLVLYHGHIQSVCYMKIVKLYCKMHYFLWPRMIIPWPYDLSVTVGVACCLFMSCCRFFCRPLPPALCTSHDVTKRLYTRINVGEIFMNERLNLLLWFLCLVSGVWLSSCDGGLAHGLRRLHYEVEVSQEDRNGKEKA